MKLKANSLLWIILILAIFYLIGRWRGYPFIDPPLCAWRFVSNFHAWNVAFPDSSSFYSVNVMRISRGDVIKIAGDIPYARYFSFQAYSIPDFMSHASIRDIDIIPEDGPNAYTNLTAAVHGIKQGRSVCQPSSQFELNLDCFKTSYRGELPAHWGWVCPPKIFVKRRYHGEDSFRPLRLCIYRRKYGVPIWDTSEPVQECKPGSEANRNHNFFLPSPFYLKGKFGNKDAKYLFSCATKLSANSTTKNELWSKVQGQLPRTANALYEAPYIANVSDYDVRYVSLSSVSRSLPYRGYSTLRDKDIIQHYERARGKDWNRRYTLYLGPPQTNASTLDFMREEQAMFLPWGASFGGAQIPFPGVLYRQILSRGQILRSVPPMDVSSKESHSLWSRLFSKLLLSSRNNDKQQQQAHRSGISEVIPETCGPLVVSNIFSHPNETFSPVVKLTTIRTILASAAVLDMDLHNMDADSAFLQSTVEEAIYVKQPPGYGNGKDQVYKLNKSLYGLKQASRNWNKEIDSRFKANGFEQSYGDPCLYIQERIINPSACR